MDTTWTDDELTRDFFDYAALAIIVAALLSCALLALGGTVAPFVVSDAYAEHNFGISLAAAALGALVAIYLLMTWLPSHGVRAIFSTMLLLAGLGYVAADKGVPATIGSRTGVEATVMFTITGRATAGRRSCAGVYVRHPDFVGRKICGVSGQRGTRLAVTGRQSWFGLHYTDVKVLP